MMRKIAAAMTALTVAGFAAGALAEGDAAAGEKVFRKCKACHMVGEGAKNRVGPELNAIIGRAAAAVEDFKYSDAMKAKAGEGLVWTEENLNAYLANPKDFIPGNKMSFAGLKKDDDRANVIAYLATFQ